MKFLVFALLVAAVFALDQDWTITVQNEDGSNSVLTPRQVLALAQKHGFSGQLAHTMVCVAKYESSYNTNAVNRNRDGSVDRGLFQINNKWWCHEGRNGCKVNCNDLFNADVNAKCARTIYSQQGYVSSSKFLSYSESMVRVLSSQGRM
ncbi:hypothetical protein RCL1_008458 [Eukaryota sp. TZLM3-RCL]